MSGLKRRDSILYLAGSLVGALFAFMYVLVGSYVWLPRSSMEREVTVRGWVPVASTGELLPGGFKEFAYGKIAGMVIKDKKGMRAVSLRCSHLGCAVAWVSDREVFSCPCHGGRFDSEGRPIGGPSRGPLQRFSIRIRKDQIYVKPGWDI